MQRSDQENGELSPLISEVSSITNPVTEAKDRTSQSEQELPSYLDKFP